MRYIDLNGVCLWVRGGCIACVWGRGGFQCSEGLYPNNHAQHTIEILQLLVWSEYTCLTQLYGVREMYNLFHKEQLHVSALFIGHLQVDK